MDPISRGTAYMETKVDLAKNMNKRMIAFLRTYRTKLTKTTSAFVARYSKP